MLTTKINKISLIKALTILSVMALPLPALAKTNASQATVTAANLNVREDAKIDSKIVGLVHQGDTFEIIQTKNGWDQIRLLSNQTGWVYDAYMTTQVPTEKIDAAVGVLFLNVRDNPSVSSHVTAKLKWGTKITIQEEQAGWAKITTSSGVTGWVCEYYITKNKHQRLAPKTSIPKTTTGKMTEKKALPPSSDSLFTSHVITAQSIETDPMQNIQGSLKGKTIVLDPGHGGMDNGTTSIVGTHEKELTLATAKAVEQKLTSAGATVIMTRTDDTFIPLQQRAEISNQNHADAFISFHYNWSDNPSVSGLTDFYYQKSKDNLLASDLLNGIIQTTGLNNIGTRYDNLCVLRNNSQPSTLLELGFLSNKQDDSVVESPAYLDEVAQGVTQGLLNYFSSKK